MQPAQESQKSGIRKDRLNRVKRVPQLIVTPRFVNEVLAGLVPLARRYALFSKQARLPG